jgi:hypothetical protein
MKEMWQAREVIHTCLVLKDPVKPQPARDGGLAATVRAQGPFTGAYGGGVLPDVSVLWLLVPRQPRWEAHGGQLVLHGVQCCVYGVA